MSKIDISNWNPITSRLERTAATYHYFIWLTFKLHCILAAAEADAVRVCRISCKTRWPAFSIHGLLSLSNWIINYVDASALSENGDYRFDLANRWFCFVCVESWKNRCNINLWDFIVARFVFGQAIVS